MSDSMIPLDHAQFQQAIAVIIASFVFTCFVSLLALCLIAKLPCLRSTTFGDICSVQMVSDILLIFLNTFWCLDQVYDLQLFAHPRAPLIIGVASKVLYFFTCKLHVLMAVNRFIVIFYSSKKNLNTSKPFKLAIFLCFLLASVQSMAGPLLDPALFVVFSRETLRWMFATTEWTEFYEAHFEYYVVLTECTVIVLLDFASFRKLHAIHRNLIEQTDAKTREMRLLLQSLCQLIPLSTVMVFFFFVAPKCKTEFLAFLCSTAVWHFGISLDGVIILIFQMPAAFFKHKVTPPATSS